MTAELASQLSGKAAYAAANADGAADMLAVSAVTLMELNREVREATGSPAIDEEEVLRELRLGLTLWSLGVADPVKGPRN